MKAVKPVLILLPLLAAILWLVSGAEVLTKTQKSQTVEVTDDLFGDTITRQELVDGPILGYYIGLDVVGGTTGASVVALLAIHWFTRKQRAASAGKESPT